MKNIKVTLSEEESSDVLNFSLCRGILKTSAVSWMYLPEDVILAIFKFLSFKDLGSVAQVCCRWKGLADTESLWKKRLITDFKLKPETCIHHGAKYWKQEYERLCDRVPCIELDKITEHTDEVLHVAFSNNGMMFSTCSKDAHVKVFNADWPFDTVFSANLGASNSILHWKYTQLSQFSPCDTQLLVSGRCSGSEQGGEIAIYNIYAGEFSIQSRVRIRPYDVMGTWLNETHILSARAHCLYDSMQCLCEVILNKSAQEIENTHQSTVTRTFLFLSNNLCTVGYLQVADLAKPIRQAMKKHFNNELKDLLHEMHCKYLTKEEKVSKHFINVIEDDKKDHLCSKCKEIAFPERRVKRFKSGSPVPPNEVTTCFSFCSKSKRRNSDTPIVPLEADPNFLLKSCGVLGTDTDSVVDSTDCPPELSSALRDATDETEITTKPITCNACGRSIASSTDDSFSVSEIDSSSAATSGDEDFSNLTLPQRYKLLICFTGNLVGVPHQIGIKTLLREECSKVVDRDISQLLKSSNYNRPEVDQWDHKIDLDGQGIGMTVSPCNRYLYVNVRRWVGDWRDQLNDMLPRPPPISNKVELLVYDLLTMKHVSSLSGHNAVSEVFFIHLSANDLYVASGSEDSRGYMWDRHYKAPVATFSHDDVVNCVAVNPRDPSMAVSVSDDKSIKIWRSKSFHRLLKGARPKARIKFRTHNQHQSSKV